MFSLGKHISRLKRVTFFALLCVSMLVVSACEQGVDKSLSLNEDGVYQNILNPDDSKTSSIYDLNSGAYRIGSGDKISITVFGENDLSNTYLVNNIGYISFPLIGTLYAEGLTLKNLEDRIRDKLMDGYLKKPSVSAQMAEFRPFYILGEVRLPGSYTFVSDMKVLNAVAMAGGYTYRANQSVVEIMQGGKPSHKTKANSNVRQVDPETYKVRPGDIILVKERFF